MGFLENLLFGCDYRPRCQRSYGYSQYMMPQMGFNTGPSCAHANFFTGQLALGPSYMLPAGGNCFGYGGGMYNMTGLSGYNPLVGRIMTGAYGLSQMVEGADNLMYAMS